MKTLFGLVVAALLILGANALGLWLLTLLIGACYAIYEARTRRSLWVALLAGVLGWGLPLWMLSSTSDVTALAQWLSRIIGLGSYGTAVVLVLPAVIGGVFAVSGAWIGSAVRGVFRSSEQTHDTSAAV